MFSGNGRTNVRFLAQPSFEYSITNSMKDNIFMIVMTLSAPKNFEARNFIRNSVKDWTEKTSRKEGRNCLLMSL